MIARCNEEMLIDMVFKMHFFIFVFVIKTFW